jgi:hypothetical protein
VLLDCQAPAVFSSIMLDCRPQTSGLDASSRHWSRELDFAKVLDMTASMADSCLT